MEATEFHFFEDAFRVLDTGLTDFVLGAASKMIGAFTHVATVLLILYVMLWGWGIMRSMIQEPIQDGLWRIVRLSLITGIAMNIGNYNTYVVDFLWRTPEALAGVITQSSLLPEPKAHYLDSVVKQYYDQFALYWASGSFSAEGLGFIAIAFLIFACGVLVTGYAAFLLAMAKITLALMLSLGPLFLLFAIFDATKQFFNSWLGQALNALFIPVLASGVITLIMVVIQSGFMKMGGGSSATALLAPSLPLAMGLVVASLIAFLILYQLPSISAALGGGLALSSLGAGGAAYNFMKRGAAGGKNLLTGKTLNDARASRRQRESNKRWAQNNPGAASKIAGAPKALYRKVTTRKNRVAQG